MSKHVIKSNVKQIVRRAVNVARTMSFVNKMKLDIKCWMNDGRTVHGCYDYYIGSFIILLPIKIVYLSGGDPSRANGRGRGQRRASRTATTTLIESTPPTNTLTELVS